MKVEQALIIGAGPAGMAAAIQLKRYGITPVILERDQIGGLLRNANLVENYLGFAGGIPGPALVRRFNEQLQQSSVEVVFEEATRLLYEDGLFWAHTPNHSYTARVCIIASGTKPKHFKDLKIPSELQEKVFYEVYPLITQSGKTVAIVGAGDAAFDYALNLSRANEVMLLNRGSATRCLPLLWERAQACDRITYWEQTLITGIRADHTGKLQFEALREGQLHIFAADYLVGALGREPQLDFAQQGFLEASPRLQSEGRLYWVGDVKNGIYRQTAIAVGDGILAAMKITQYLQENTE